MLEMFRSIWLALLGMVEMLESDLMEAINAYEHSNIILRQLTSMKGLGQDVLPTDEIGQGGCTGTFF